MSSIKRNAGDWIIALFYAAILGDWLVASYLKEVLTKYTEARFLDGTLIFVFFGFSFLAALVHPPRTRWRLLTDVVEVVGLLLVIPAAGYTPVIDDFVWDKIAQPGGIYVVIGVLIVLHLICRVFASPAEEPVQPPPTPEQVEKQEKRTKIQNRMRIAAVVICLTVAFCHPLSYLLHLGATVAMLLCIVIYVSQDDWN